MKKLGRNLFVISGLLLVGVGAARSVFLSLRPQRMAKVPGLVALWKQERSASLASIDFASPPVDRTAARASYLRAAEEGDARAAHAYARLLGPEANAAEVERWLNRAAEGGWTPAMIELGARVYARGNRDAMALAWFWVAAEAGDAEGRYNLGKCLLHGRGIEQDKSAAIASFHRAAAEGSVAAREALEKLGEA